MSHDKDPQTIPLVQERLIVEKQRRVTDRVKVSTTTETVEDMVSVDLMNMDVDVVRVPVERDIDVVPDVVTDGDLTIIPVVEERVVITRQLVLREEIHVRRTERRDVSDIPVSIRRQTALIEHLGPDAQHRANREEDSQDDL